MYIKGWQSWTQCVARGLRSQCDYSPHHIQGWHLPPTKKVKDPVIGWCSWYSFGKNINEEKILGNAREFASYPSKTKDRYILIDDGWSSWGDWNKWSKSKFSNGLQSVATTIKNFKLKPGIWIAPFLADKHSDYATRFSDTLIRNRYRLIDGLKILPFNIPFFAFKALLDMENKKVRKYIYDCISIIVEEWGFELLKLDFLYAIYFNPRYTTPQIPDQILKDFLLFIKRTYPHVYTIGCGCPLGPAAGLVDSMRISADTIHTYLDNFWPFNRIVNSGALFDLQKNIEIRNNFHKIWNIDPDVLVTRKSSGFTKQKIATLKQLIKQSKGNVFLGDDLRRIKMQNIFLEFQI